MTRNIKFAVICLFIVIFMGTTPLKVQASTTFDEKYEQNGSRITTFTQIDDTKSHTAPTSPQKNHNYLKLFTTLDQKSRSGREVSPEETLPDEYGEFIDSLPDGVTDSLPDSAFSSDSAEILGAAEQLGSVSYLLGTLLESFGGAIGELLPTLAILCGIVILSAVCHLFASNLGGLSATVTFAARLISFCAIAASAVSSLSRLRDYFDSLFSAVASFLPLTSVLYASGGNLTAAASGTITLNAILSVCQLIFTKTVIPVFSVCLSMSLLSVFDGVGGFASQSISVTVKKWYTTALAFVMMILTTALAAQTILSAKADNAAMKGMKFAASSFIPVSGGAVSSTLGTLAASVELMRGAVGVIGVAVILLLLIPIIVELALLRAVFALAAFLAGMLGCSSEHKLLNEIGSLYGYLEGVAVLSSVVFIIAFAIFAATCSAVG